MSEKYINLIATVDLAKRKGKILYVNPVGAEAAGTAPEQPVDNFAQGIDPARAQEQEFVSNLEILLESVEGEVLKRIRPRLKVSQCQALPPANPDAPGERAAAPAPASGSGIIDEFIPVVPGFNKAVLVYKGEELSSFVSGGSVFGAAGMREVRKSLGGIPSRMSLRTAATMLPEKGITFTVQVMPEGTRAWQTIAIGRDRPVAQLDPNQFPGAERARVRILRSTGFDDEIFVEEEVKLGFEAHGDTNPNLEG